MVEGFLSDGDACWLADDVVLDDGYRRECGRAAVLSLLSSPVLRRPPAVLVVEDCHAAAQWAGAAASYAVTGGEITAIHLYGRWAAQQYGSLSAR